MDLLRTEVNHLIDELDDDFYPETCKYLNLDEWQEASSYDFATELVRCDKGKDKPRAVFDFIVELYKDAIEDGNADAMNDLGALYYDGYGCEQDFSKAVLYYEEAARNGSRQAAENLGYCYYYGRNVPVDYKKAFHYFALGAFDGHLISLYKIGDMYQKGYYVEQNPKEAFYIYMRCLDTMTEEAEKVVAGPVFLRLGFAFLNGNGVEEDPKRALYCLQRAECFLFDMVQNGDVMYKKSLQLAIKGQEEARAKMNAALPKKQWLDGKSL